MDHEQSPMIVEELTDPEELMRARTSRQRFDRNSIWFQEHATELYRNYRGRCVCIAGEELFVADTAEQAIAEAATAHPEDTGRFVHYIPRERLPRIYGNYR